ncbi:MAG TPA: SA1362 family protein [Bacillota bacterium]
MARKTLPILIYGIIGLAIVGIFSELFTNTVNFLTSVFIMIGIGVAIFGAFYVIFLRNKNPSEMKKYRQAVKQSKRKYKQTFKPASITTKFQTTQKRKKLRRRPHHLRVIEGNKSKRKKRASN